MAFGQGVGLLTLCRFGGAVVLALLYSRSHRRLRHRS